MSTNRHLAPGVYTKPLKTNIAVVTDAVGVLRFPLNSNKFPLTVILVCSFYSFSGFNLHTILPNVTFSSVGTYVFEMKTTVFVPFTVMIPWANCPSSFTKDRSQFFLSLSLTICLYSWATTDI